MNAARDLLNYVDEHKEEMKDETYKNIVEKLTPINDELKAKQPLQKYVITFMITSVGIANKTRNIIETHPEMKVKNIEFQLTHDEYLDIYNTLERGSYIANLCQLKENRPNIESIENVRILLEEDRREFDLEYYIDPFFVNNMDFLTESNVERIKDRIREEEIDISRTKQVYIIRIRKTMRSQ